MKGFSVAGVVSFVVLYFSACKEIGPDINLRDNENAVSDTTYVESPVAAPETKNVLIEEFTGVRCPNCPQGHDIIEAIKNTNAGRVVSVSLHPINSLGNPYIFSVQNFQNQKAQTLFDYFGQIGLEPAATIDRTLFSGETNLLLEKAKWSSNTTAQLATATPVNLELESNYDTSTRELTIITSIHYTTADTTSSALTILLTESKMVTAQLNGATIDTFYTHNDVMREVVTNTKGDALTAPRAPGRVVRKVYKTMLDNAWVAENMFIVAYVHEYLATKRVYQVKEIHVVE